MPCPEPHPLWLQGAYGLHPDLERIGGCGDDAWLRCRLCHEWFWICDDTSSKWQYSGSWHLDRARAERAFAEGSLLEAVQLAIDEKLPRGPNAVAIESLVALLEAFAPTATDDERRQALRAARLDERWRRVLSRLEGRAAAREAPPAPALVFAQDLAFDGEGIDELYELTRSLVGLRAGARPEIVRVDVSGAVSSTPLPSRPRLLGHAPDRVVFSVETASGHRIMAIDDGGRVIDWPPAPLPAYALSLDDGHWLLFTRTEVSTAQLFDPSFRLLFTYRFALGRDAYPPPPRRFAGGWIASAVLDKAGRDHALTLMVPDEGVKAVSAEGMGARLMSPLSASTLLASTLQVPLVVETWQVDGSQLVRRDSVPARGLRVVDGTAILLVSGAGAGNPSVRRSRPDGSRVWERELPPSRGGHRYLADAPGAALIYDDDEARLLSVDDGRELASFEVLGEVHVLGNEREAVYVLTGDQLRILTAGQVRVIPVPARGIATTCGGGVLLSLRESDRYRLVGPDGQPRGDFQAPGARFSVTGTRGGPYVLEPGRLRIARWPGQMW